MRRRGFRKKSIKIIDIDRFGDYDFDLVFPEEGVVDIGYVKIKFKDNVLPVSEEEKEIWNEWLNELIEDDGLEKELDNGVKFKVYNEVEFYDLEDAINEGFHAIFIELEFDRNVYEIDFSEHDINYIGDVIDVYLNKLSMISLPYDNRLRRIIDYISYEDY